VRWRSAPSLPPAVGFCALFRVSMVAAPPHIPQPFIHQKAAQVCASSCGLAPVQMSDRVRQAPSCRP
jgi:hypothetical protein